MKPSTDTSLLEFLRRVPLLAAMSPVDLESLLPHLDEGHLPAGHMIVGDRPLAAVAFLVEGHVAARPREGRVRTLGKGAVLGCLRGCDAPHEGERVYAVTPVVVAYLPASRFNQVQAGVGTGSDESKRMQGESGRR